jgi:uncharacterized protein YcfJ
MLRADGTPPEFGQALLHLPQPEEICMRVLSSWLCAALCASFAGHAAATVTFYEHEGFRGQSITLSAPLANFNRGGFNDRASSVVVAGERWEVCEDVRYAGRCVVLRPGSYTSLASLGLNDRISSAHQLERMRPEDEARYAPAPVMQHDWRRQQDERVFEARVTDVRAVVEESGQRCWVERQEIPQERSSANVPGALLGAVIGGVLGHQIGAGSGRDVATGLGAVGGAVIGGNINRPRQEATATRDVQRCRRTSGAAHPAYWDVSYEFRGVQHNVQMTTPPGDVVMVNDQGEPRV